MKKESFVVIRSDMADKADQRLSAFLEQEYNTSPKTEADLSPDPSPILKPRRAVVPRRNSISALDDTIRVAPEKYRDVVQGRWVDLVMANGEQKTILVPSVHTEGKPAAKPVPAVFPWVTRPHVQNKSSEDFEGEEWVPTSIGLVAADDGYVTKRNDKVAKDNIKRANTQRIPKASGNRRKSVNKRDSWYQGRQKKPSKII